MANRFENKTLSELLAGDTAALLMTALEPQPPTPESWRRFGGELAALHASAAPRPGYGFDTDNHLADIAMMKLFGGFPGNCFDAYAAAVDDRDDMERRIAVYQLYHVLNHVNLFGRGYAAQAMALVRRLGG